MSERTGGAGFRRATWVAEPLPPGPLWHSVALVVLAAAVIFGIAYGLTAEYCDEQQAAAERMLEDTARGASFEVYRWLEGGADDVEVVAMQAGMAERYTRWQAGLDPQFPRLFGDRIQAERQIRGYRSVAMYTVSGELFVVSPKDSPDVDSPAVVAAVPEALRSEHPLFVDHFHDESGEWCVLWAAPMRATGGGEPVGVMVYTLGMGEPAATILGDNEVPFESGGVALVRADAGDFDILSSERGFEPVTMPRGPELHTELVEAAVSGETIVRRGVAEGGTRVIAAATRISDTDWVMAARVEQSEVDAPVFRYASLTGLSSLLMVFGVAFVSVTARRTREVRYREHQDFLKLQEALDTRDTFLANMSHELRTPLHSIMGFTSIMLSGLAGPVNEEQQRQLTMVDESSKRLLALVDDVLDLSKIRAGHTQVVATEFTARDIERVACEIMQPLFELKSLELMRYVPEPALALLTDRDMVERIVLNLLSNAIKFTDEGYVRFEVKPDGPAHAIFQVVDTGRGIPEKELERVMEEFHQVVEPRGVKPVGTGLGLAISRRMAEALGGYLAVESVVGAGSRFWLRIPRVYPDHD